MVKTHRENEYNEGGGAFPNFFRGKKCLSSWGESMALLRGKRTVAWKCWFEPSSTCWWQAASTKELSTTFHQKAFYFQLFNFESRQLWRTDFFLLYFERVRLHALVVFRAFEVLPDYFFATWSWLGQHLTHNFQVWKINWETFLGSIFCLRALVVRNLSSTSNAAAAAVAHQLLPSLKGCPENWPKWESTEWKFA